MSTSSSCGVGQTRLSFVWLKPAPVFCDAVCNVSHRGPRAARRARRPEAGAPPHLVCNERPWAGAHKTLQACCYHLHLRLR